MKKSNKGFTLIELIIVIAILGIIALIAIPNLSGIRQRSQINADIRTAEQIGKAIRIWETDSAATDTRTVPALAAGALTNYGALANIGDYISDTYDAKSFGTTAGEYYVAADANNRIMVAIGAAAGTNYATTGNAAAGTVVGTTVTYNGNGTAGWAYIEK